MSDVTSAIKTVDALLQAYKSGQRSFVSLSLTAADLSDADLKGVDLSYADLSGANLARVNLRGAISAMPAYATRI